MELALGHLPGAFDKTIRLGIEHTGMFDVGGKVLSKEQYAVDQGDTSKCQALKEQYALDQEIPRGGLQCQARGHGNGQVRVRDTILGQTPGAHTSGLGHGQGRQRGWYRSRGEGFTEMTRSKRELYARSGSGVRLWYWSRSGAVSRCWSQSGGGAWWSRSYSGSWAQSLSMSGAGAGCRVGSKPYLRLRRIPHKTTQALSPLTDTPEL